MSESAVTADAAARVAAVWKVLAQVLDPEVPALSVCDLGIVRDVLVRGAALEIVLTPTYSGCPATEVIEQDVLIAVNQAQLGPASVTLRRAPAWTSDWISPEGRQKLADYGIAPPHMSNTENALPLRFFGRADKTPPLRCPKCGSNHTQQLSPFGSTACKALYRCLACREPFEYFKPI